MPRPQKNRIVHEPPLYSRFSPDGSVREKNKVNALTLDAYEAFRLADYLAYSHEDAAREMEISRSTFSRLIEEARKKIADCIINGKTLLIEGGNIHFRNNILHCRSCGYLFKINFNEYYNACPDCNSASLINVAGSFGHGKKCCS
jgi:uncharacterized protein